MNRISIFLVFCVIASACLLVAIRHENRLEFVHLQELEQINGELQAQWGRLMLEKATWSETHNIAEYAKSRLNMTTPAADKITTVDLRQRRIDAQATLVNTPPLGENGYVTSLRNNEHAQASAALVAR